MQKQVRPHRRLLQMQTLETLKRSIESAEDLGNVVRTMKTMAAVSIRQYETATESLTEYSRTINTGLRMLLSRLSVTDRNNIAAAGAGADVHTAAETVNLRATAGEATAIQEFELLPRTGRQTSSRHASKPTITGGTGGIIFGSDQGMCGQFNEQIANFAQNSLKQAANETKRICPVLCVGHRVADNVTNSGLVVDRIFRLPGSAGGITSLAQDMLPVIDTWRAAHEVNRILVFHNRRLSASTWRPFAQQLLPLRLDRLLNEAHTGLDTGITSRSLPTWTMDTSVLFSRLVKQFLFVSLFQACAESMAGENASRIAAMQAAERNIKDRLAELQSTYASRRQTIITEELMDVVTGFEALKPNAAE